MNCVFDPEPAERREDGRVRHLCPNCNKLSVWGKAGSRFIRGCGNTKQVAKLGKWRGVGVGDELKRLFSAANLHDKKGCGCNALASKMNQWGVAGCRARQGEIVAKLQKAAHENGMGALADFADAMLAAAIEAVCQRDREAVDGFLGALPPCPPCEHRGIVTSAGGESLELHAYVLFRLLRALGCTLPIQCYYSGAAEFNPRFGDLIAGLDVEYVDAVALGYKPHPAALNVKFRGSDSYKPGWINGYTLKAWAIAHCPFQHVAWIDADSHPCRDPNELFDTEEYRVQRALLWQEPGDAGHAPDWSSLGIELPEGSERGLETGQLFVDKQEHWKALSLASWFCENAAHWFRYSWGDKDCFLGAFLYTQSRFWLAPHPQWRSGVAIIQPGTDGAPLFYHRAGQGAKLKAGQPDKLTDHPLQDVIASAVKDFTRTDVAKVQRWEKTAKAAYWEEWQGEKLLLHLHDGIDLYVDPHDDRLVRDFRRQGYWEAFVVRAMQRYVKPGMTVMDIGANFGYFTLLLSKLVGDEGRVISVEPNPRMLDYLLRNVAGYRNVTVAPVALSDFDGRATLTYPENDPALGSIVLEGYAVQETVDVTTLDRLAADLKIESLDFAKIDAEGSEPGIFRGGAETLGRFNPSLVVEYAGERYTDEPGYIAELEKAYPLRAMGFNSYPRVISPAELMRDRKAVWMLWLEPSTQERRLTQSESQRPQSAATSHLRD